MRAVVYDRYGAPSEVLRLDPSADAPAPEAGEVLVRVLVRPVRPGDLVNAATYDLEDFRDAVEHAERPGRSGAVLLSG